MTRRALTDRSDLLLSDVLEPKDRIATIGANCGQVATVLSAAFVTGGLYYTSRKFVPDRDKQHTGRFTSATGSVVIK